MPANIAHVITVHKASELLRTKGFDDLAAGRNMRRFLRLHKECL
jgi:hypothetical protein